MVYLRLTGRALINLHSANAEGAVGNYMSLSKMFVVRRTAEGIDVSEEPVISGNMVKHWHAVALVDLLKSWGYDKLCENCSRHVMFRSNLGLNDEIEYIEKCAIEDLHGFLDPNKQIRRESVCKFSFIIPVEDIRAEYSAVTHNRVVINEKGAVATEQAMMIMKREYASGLYGFGCTMDLTYAGRSQSNPSKVIDVNERKIRIKAAILSLGHVFSGQVGAAQARALPIMKVTEAIILISKRPIPNAIHGFYMDYAEETAGILKALVEKGFLSEGDFKVYAVGSEPAKALREVGLVFEEKKSLSEAIACAAEDVEKWL
ncbi:MAG: type I-A CRISPR-associated protein Cas7/Csa2 [archaeon GB-1867-005]|nr:type I-A CRISPR-associated protein Cas7/Csa2 [Candidatus Culexmicrobium cathedralense]